MKAFPRNIETHLKEWKHSSERKPLIIRGARQTGKTTTVLRFAQAYPQYIHANLDRYEDLKLFETERPLSELVDDLFFSRGLQQKKGTLIFIDEIQQSSRAIHLLRYFLEDYPSYHIIATGSMLEQSLNAQGGFPVGRVNYLYMHPVSFFEFLNALGEDAAADMYQQVPLPAYAHDKMLSLFHRYAVLGGMPEAVRLYAESHDVGPTRSVYEDLIHAYSDDIRKYPVSESRKLVVQHVFNTMLFYPMQRVTFNGYGESNYGSAQVKEAFTLLEKAMLCKLEYPLTSTSLPLQPNLRKKPRLHMLDTGLSTHSLGVREEMLSLRDLTDSHKGILAEHIVGQELRAASLVNLNRERFWVREKKQSSAEVDYIIQFNGKLVPVEVKSGSTGRLRSLMQFLDMSDIDVAVRLYAGSFSKDTITTMKGKRALLLNIPYYHAAKIEEYLQQKMILYNCTLVL